MAIHTWTAGTVGLTWATVMSTELNAIANGNAIVATTALDNSANLDIYADFGYLAGATATTAAPNYLALYLYPLNEDGSTYGDGRFGSSAAGPPPSNYLAGVIGFAAAASTTISGVFRKVELPPGLFKPVIYNQSGVALAATSNLLKWRTYDDKIA